MDKNTLILRKNIREHIIFHFFIKMLNFVTLSGDYLPTEKNQQLLGCDEMTQL